MPKARKTCNVFFSSMFVIFAFVLLWISLLAFRKARTPLEWAGAIGMTEAGHWFAFFPILLLAASFWLLSNNFLDWLGRITLAAAIFCMISSVFRAFVSQRVFVQKLDEAFGNLPTRFKLLQGSRLFVLPWEASVKRNRHRFAERDKKGLFLDFFAAKKESACGVSPCVVAIHGGGWNSGNTRQLHWLNSRLAKQGTHVAAIQYRHTPKATWPAQLEDLEEAVSWLKTNAKELNLDPDKIILFGRSAGGQVALSHACTPGMSSVAACISVYAPCDMEWGWEHSRTDDILNSKKLLANLFGVEPGPMPDLLPTASPCSLAKTAENLPPFLLLHGIRDELVSVHHAREMTRILEKRGACSCYLELPWATHAFEFSLNGPSGQIATAAIQHMINYVKSSHSPKRLMRAWMEDSHMSHTGI